MVYSLNHGSEWAVLICMSVVTVKAVTTGDGDKHSRRNRGQESKYNVKTTYRGLQGGRNTSCLDFYAASSRRYVKVT